MSRYIDADAMIARASQDSERMYLESVVRHTPSIDLVRCKECKHRYNDGWIEPRWTCDYLKDMRLKDDDYCSYGERKESEDE